MGAGSPAPIVIMDTTNIEIVDRRLVITPSHSKDKRLSIEITTKDGIPSDGVRVSVGVDSIWITSKDLLDAIVALWPDNVAYQFPEEKE